MLKKLRKNYRRLVAFMLTIAMTFTNVGTNLNVAFAAGEEQEALFLVDGADLKEAIQDAVDGGETFKFSSLELKTNSKSLKTSYEKLIGGKNGKVYQLDVDVDERYAPEGTSVEVFYNAGTEDVIFLFINESDMVVKFRANVDGYETARVTINPNAVNVDDTEASYVEDYSNTTMVDDMPPTLGAEVLNPTTGANADEGTEAEETPEAVEGTAGETSAADGSGNDESSSAQETTADESSESGDSVEGETTEAASDNGGEEGETTGAAGDNGGEEGETTGAAGDNGSGESETTEAAGEDTDAADSEEETTAADEAAGEENEPETEAEAEDSSQTDTEDAADEEAEAAGEAQPEAGSATASISIRKLQQVASSVQVLDDADIVIDAEDVPEDGDTEISEDSQVEVETDAADQEEPETTVEAETEAETEETRAAETEESEADETEDDTEQTGAAETEETTETDAEAGDTEESSGASDAADENGDADIIIEETTAAGDTDVTDTPVEVETPAETTPADGNNAGETQAPDENNGAADIPDLSDGQELEDDINGTLEHLGTLNGRAYNTVTIWDSANARAYKVAAKDLTGIDAVAGMFRVDYSVDPLGAAEIKGSKTINEGENLYFAVNPQVGFEISSVTANGTELEAVDTAETGAGELAGYEFVYAVEEASEDLEILVSLEEVSEHPAFADQKTAGGINVSVSAEEGVLPADTVLLVEEVGNREALIEAAQNQIDPSAEETRVSDVIAFDIRLETQDGRKVNFDGDVVEVTFSGSRIRRMTEEADQVQVSYVEAAGDSSREAVEAAQVSELTADLIKEQDVSGTAVREVAFEAEHFTTIQVTFTERVVSEEIWTVRFYESEEAETPFVTQSVKNGAGTIAPYAEERDGYEFLGWVEKGDDSKTIVDFGTVEKNLDVYPEYKSLDTVILRVDYEYSDGSKAAESYIATVPKGETRVVESPTIEGFTADKKTVTLSEDNLSETVTYTGNERTYMVYYRKQSLDNEQVYEQVGQGTERTGIAGEKTDIDVAGLPTYTGFVRRPFNNVRIPGGSEDFAIYIDYDREKYLLIYDTDGGSYVAPQSVKYGAVIQLPEENPTKLGFEFAGWDAAAGTTMPAAQKTVTATWKEATEAAYTVVYWQEKVPGTYDESDGIQYDFFTVDYGTGTVGSTIGYKSQEETGFSLNRTKTDAETVKITSDGKAVKNVYFDRNTYTIRFLVSDGYDSGTHAPIYKEIGSITAKYGADISTEWNEKAENYQWKSGDDKKGGKIYSLLKDMPAENLQLFGTPRGTEIDVIYYADGLNDETILKGVEKREAFYNSATPVYNQDGSLKFDEFGNPVFTNVVLEKVDVAQFEGFTFLENSRPEDYLRGYKGMINEAANDPYHLAYPLRYSRNTYNIVFEDCTIDGNSEITDNKASRKYEAPIAEVRPGTNEITPPAEYSGYTFAGWYTSPTYEEAVDWSATMPAKNLRFFAKWDPPVYTVTLHPNNGEGVTTVPVSKGTFYDKADITEPTKAGDTFDGWYLDANFEFPYVNRQITENIHLYAKWKSDDQLTYSIRYVEQNEAGRWVAIEGVTQPEDQTVARGEYVTVDAIGIPGYTAITPMVSARISERNMTIEIQYRKEETWSYIVRYVDADGNDLPGTAPETFSTTDQIVTVSYKPITGYMLMAGETAQRTVEKPANSGAALQEIVFRYRSSYVDYTIRYFYNGTENPDIPSKMVSGIYGHQVTEAEIRENHRHDVEGFELVEVKNCPLTLGLDGNPEIEVYYVNQVTVDFKVQNPGTDEFTSVAQWPKAITKGTDVTPPDQDQTKTDANGIRYYFDGWYKDSGCTEKAAADDFANIQNDTVFYAKYELEFSVNAEDSEKVYDGKPLGPNVAITDSAGNTIDADIEYEVNGSWTKTAPTITNVGEETYNVRVTVNGVSKETSFTLKVTKRQVVLTSADLSKEYDGTALTNGDTALAVESGWADGEGASYTFIGSQTLVGNSPNA
ncbi:MAG: hypothetical protein HFG64_01130, partial [Lachnospiraceae bacterium]|nr:hypothetical protein [Lachnospiraceae bacterium]